MDTQRKWSTIEQEVYRVYYAVTKWNYYLQGAEGIIQNNHKPLARFLNGKKCQHQSKQMGFKLATYNIIFEGILGASNKAADYLSRLVELPHDRQATVQMLSATSHDEPTFYTRSRTAQSNMKEHLTPHPTTDTTTPDITKFMDTPDVTPKPLTNDRLQALLQM